MDAYQEFIFKSRYARWLPELQRREDWAESIDRYLSFFAERYPKVVKPVYQELFTAIESMEVVPSMRALMTAGPALERDEIASYNCSYLPIDSLRSFDESLYLLLCGVGVGFSVERQYIAELPAVASEFHDSDTVIIVADSKIGWCKALKETIALAFSGQIPKWDFSRIRKAGEPLLTFGGRASGPEPLKEMLAKVVDVIRGAAGRRLTSIECHDIQCYIASCVVVGGVRRAAMISLSNLSDQRMALAKSGAWYEMDGQRALSNNSVIYTDKPDVGGWMREWQNIYESKSGERGIINREALKKLSPERRDTEQEFGVNPCAEVILRERGLCNLSEVIARPNDNGIQLARKIRAASILGTLQSTLTNFRYLSKRWQHNAEEERLLGVSITGIYDNHWLLSSTPKQLHNLRQMAVDTNIEFAGKLGINPSVAVTCVKPSGSVSQLTDSASGIHPRYAHQYWRRVRNDKKDPISDALIEAGVPHVTDPYNSEAWSFTFPKVAPTGAVVNADITAIQHLEMWKHFAVNFCEHKPSVTISVDEHEWPEVGAWCWENFDILSGVSFLPKESSNHTYVEAPYEICTAKDIKAYPKTKQVQWDKIMESQDKQTEFACSSGACEI